MGWHVKVFLENIRMIIIISSKTSSQMFLSLALLSKTSMSWWLSLFPGSDQISRSVVSDSLRPHESQHARPSCPSPAPGVYSNSSPLSWWCHPTISSSITPFSSCPQSLLASGSFPRSQLFASGSQSIRASASASVLLKNIQDWFPLELTGLISSKLL